MAHCVAKAEALAARGRDIKLVVTMSPPEVNKQNGAGPIWSSAALQSSYVGLWRQIAAAYAGRSVIAGFDICNEPFAPGSFREGQTTWFAFAKTIRDAIREHDPTRTIILQTSPHARPMVHDTFPSLPSFPDLPPWAFDNVVWSYHMYEPTYEFTHQKVPHYSPDPQIYQSTTNPAVTLPGSNYPYGQLRYNNHSFVFDKNFLRSVLAPIRAFQLRARVPVYIGEFSAARWCANSSHRDWVADVISIFKEYGWAWTFHSFRGYSGWDYEKDWSSATSPEPARNPANSPGWQILVNSLAS
jgi:aryl-phospho-beta-D-glucosidase BglC (GH1 family)